MGGLSYNKRDYINTGAYDFPAPMSSYLGWTGAEWPEPNWNPLAVYSYGVVKQKAAYVAARLSLADPLKLIVGARYTDWKRDGVNDSLVPYAAQHKETTPYAGLVYTINDTWSAYASYTDIFQPQEYRNQAGSYLDPVTGKSYEAGVKAAWFDDRLNASLSVFRIEQDNVAQATTELVNGSTTGEFAYIAARGTVSRGFELEVNGELTPGWNATFGYSRYIAKDASDSDINTNLPNTTVKLYTSYTPRSIAELTFGGGVNWQNGIYYDVATYGRFEQGDYALVTAFARYRLSPEFSVQVNLNNLLDKKYYAQITGYGAWGEPRNGSLTFTWSF